MKNISIFLFIVSLTFLVACKEKSAQESGSTLLGQVVDLSTGQPLTGAMVCIQNTTQCAKADGNGNYTLSNISVSHEQVFEISASGYISAVQTLAIIQNDTLMQNFALTADIQSREISDADLTGGGSMGESNRNVAESDNVSADAHEEKSNNNILSLVMTDSIDQVSKPIGEKTVFSNLSRRIFAVIDIENITSGTEFGAFWYRDGTRIEENPPMIANQNYNRVYANFFPDPIFYNSKPGSYEVQIYINNQLSKSTQFTVK